MSKIPNKGAGNKAAEMAAMIPTAFASLRLVDQDKKDKATFKWQAVFDSAADKLVEGAHIEYKEAKGRYEKGQTSISQQFLSFARAAGGVDQFNEIYTAMCFVWKETNSKGGEKADLPQAIQDAASVIRRSWAASIDPTKATSVHALKKALKDAKKAEADALGNAQPTEFSKALVGIGELYKQCSDQPQLQDQLASALLKVGKDFAVILAKTVGDVAPTKTTDVTTTKETKKATKAA